MEQKVDTQTKEMMEYLGNIKRNQPVRIVQFITAALVLALSTYTLTGFPNWKEVRFTVATVLPSTLDI